MQTKRTTFPSQWLPYALMAPQVAITLVFFIWPAFQALRQSVLRQDPFGLRTTFAGFANFERLFSDPYYLNSMKVTAVFAVSVTLLSMSVALLLAVMVNRMIRSRDAYTTFLVWPYAVAPAVAGILWWFIFNPTIGILPYMLRMVGYDWNHRISSTDAMILIVIAAAWKQVSYNFLFFLAGLQSIPHSLIEAAAIDGAGPAKRFWTIVFPLLSPTTFFLVVVNTVYAMFDTFGIIHATTQGGPAQATQILVYKVYQDGFVGLNLGSSAAQSVVLMAIVIVLTVIQFRFIERRVQYLMVENRPWLNLLAHLVLILGVAIVVFPVYVAFVASTQPPGKFLSGVIPLWPSTHMVENYKIMLGTGMTQSGAPPLGPMLFNSLVMALSIAIGKIAISILSAFAIVYFRFPFRVFFFWLIFVTLMLPVEVRIIPTFEVVSNLGMLNSYAGLSVPLIASATATFLFRQFYMTVPEELMEAARVDGAGPMKFFRDILLPLSLTNIAALFVILFIYGWNQYLWPLIITTDPGYYTVVMGIQRMAANADSDPQWQLVMAAVILAALPPVLVIFAMQRLFVKGLTETEK